jgi:hypothetical protein
LKQIQLSQCGVQWWAVANIKWFSELHKGRGISLSVDRLRI